jgi:predicted PurR-regulated permease PerM
MLESHTIHATSSGGTWKSIALFLITASILNLCIRIASPFQPANVGAIVLAVTTHGPYISLQKRIRNRTLAASLAIAIVTLCILVPALFLLPILGQYVTRAAYALQDGSLEKAFSESMNRYPQLVTLFHRSSELVTLSHAAEKTAEFIATNLVTLLSNSFATLTQGVITLFILFFLYRDERLALSYLEQLLPMSQRETDHLLARIDGTIRATFLGTFVVAVIQGLLSAIVFVALRLTDAAVLGVLVTLAAIIPYFGAYVVWLPVAIYLALTGHWIAALVLVLFGTLIISSLDNFLYPILVGAQLNQHPVTVLISLLGGIWLFGIAGLIVGPVLFSVADALLAVWRTRLVEQDSHAPDVSAATRDAL